MLSFETLCLSDQRHKRQQACIACCAPPAAAQINGLVLQAFLYKHYGQRNARQFAPHALREAAPGERMGPAVGANFVQLEGLGKIPFSNVRRPKPLMDVSAEAAEVRVRCSDLGCTAQES